MVEAACGTRWVGNEGSNPSLRLQRLVLVRQPVPVIQQQQAQATLIQVTAAKLVSYSKTICIEYPVWGILTYP